MKKVEHLIKEVYPGSIAEELEIEPGDVLLSINDQSIEDVFDYRYMIKDEYIEVLIRKPDGEEWDPYRGSQYPFFSGLSCSFGGSVQ